MTIEEAVDFCREKNIEIKGQLCYDPYIGWIDEHESYQDDNCGPYCCICDLNIADKLCCKEICGIYPREDVK